MSVISTSFATSLQTAVTRIKAMQLLAITDAKQSTDYELQSAEYPRWENFLGPMPAPTSRGGTGATTRYEITVTMRLICGTLQEGYDGELQQTIMWTYIPAILNYFTPRANLIYEAGQAVIPGMIERSEPLGPSQGLRVSDGLLYIDFPLNLIFDVRYNTIG